MHWAATYGILYRRTQLVDSTLSLRGLQMPFDASGALILHLLSIRKVSKALGLSKTPTACRHKNTPPPNCGNRGHSRFSLSASSRRSCICSSESSRSSGMPRNDASIRAMAFSPLNSTPSAQHAERTGLRSLRRLSGRHDGQLLDASATWSESHAAEPGSHRSPGSCDGHF